MPSFIISGPIFANNPQQNASTSLGQTNMNGWDANMKFNAATGATFGFFNVVMTVSTLFDNLEMIDGAINDSDLKPTWNVTV